MESEVIEVKIKLEKAIKDVDLDVVLDCLKKAQNFKITKDILRNTDIGKTVNGLKEHKDIGISKESKALIDKWKSDISNTNNNNTTTTTTKSSTTPLKSSGSNIKTESPGTLKRKSSDTVSTTTERPSKKSVDLESSKNSTPKTISPPATPKTTPSGQLISSINPISSGTHAELRNKSIQLFIESLTTESDDTISSPEEIAIEIEAELFDIYRGVTIDYKTKLRSFKFNLKKNDNLRLSLLDRKLAVSEFCQMDVMSMASDELKEERKKLDEFNTGAAMIGNNNEATTDQFQCGKCKQRKCTYTQLQTRSADEPPTTFVRCCVKGCGNRWRFC